METNGLVITERIDKLLVSHNLSRNDLYRELKIASNSLPTWKSRGTIPAADVALRIADFLNVSLEFLLYGMEKDISNSERDLISRYRDLSEDQKAAVLAVVSSFEDQNSKKNKNAI